MIVNKYKMKEPLCRSFVLLQFSAQCCTPHFHMARQFQLLHGSLPQWQQKKWGSSACAGLVLSYLALWCDFWCCTGVVRLLRLVRIGTFQVLCQMVSIVNQFCLIDAVLKTFSSTFLNSFLSFANLKMFLENIMYALSQLCQMHVSNRNTPLITNLCQTHVYLASLIELVFNSPSPCRLSSLYQSQASVFTCALLPALADLAKFEMFISFRFAWYKSSMKYAQQQC